jgi:SAM-dependent methyltransferase
VGKLQDHHWFAGERLPTDIPGGGLYACSCCYLKFRSPTPAPELLRQLYDNTVTDTWSEEGSEREDWKRISELLRRRVGLGARILDYGCFTGGLLHGLGTEYERYGIEINRAAADIARAKDGIVVWDDLDEAPASLRFQAIVLSDVIEHVVDPGALLDRLLDRLDADGLLIVSTGDSDNRLWHRLRANWWYCFPPEHVAFISHRWLESYAERRNAGVLEITKFRYAPLSARRLITDLPLTLFFGIAPRAYLELGYLWKRIMSRDGALVVRGVGLTEDHLVAVLKRHR